MQSNCSLIPQAMSGPCLSQIGLIADVQYCDRENGWDYQKTKQRFYRNSLPHLQRAIREWITNEVDVVIHLGDLLDGHCRGQGDEYAALETITSAFKALDPVQIHYCIGNHELYNFTRDQLWATHLTAIPRDLRPKKEHKGSANYTFTPCAGYRVILLDSYDVSILGVADDSAEFELGYSTLRRWNQNNLANLNNPEGLEKRNFIAMNGGVGRDQLAWLTTQLEACVRQDEQVIIAMHCPIILEAATASRNLLWNHEQLLGLLQRFAPSIALVLAGHTHRAGCTVDPAGILHLTLPGVVEALPPGERAQLTLSLYQGGLLVHGNDTIPRIWHPRCVHDRVRFAVADKL